MTWRTLIIKLNFKTVVSPRAIKTPSNTGMKQWINTSTAMKVIHMNYIRNKYTHLF